MTHTYFNFTAPKGLKITSNDEKEYRLEEKTMTFFGILYHVFWKRGEIFFTTFSQIQTNIQLYYI